VTLSIEMHCSAGQQARMADICREILVGSNLIFRNFCLTIFPIF
jgi:hypothetical protein